MKFSDILLAIVAICTFVSYMPQVIKILKTKKSNDISICSWILWVISSSSYTLYAYIASTDIMLQIETTIELIFCITILILSIKYQHKN